MKPIMFRQDSSSPQMRMALALMGNQKPIRHWSDGLSNAANTIAGALLSKRAQTDQKAEDLTRSNKLAQALKSAQGWKDPDTGVQKVAGTGMDGLAKALMASGDPTLTERGTGMIAANMEFDRNAQESDRLYTRARADKLEDAETAYGRAVNLAGIKSEGSMQAALERMLAEDKLERERMKDKPYIEVGMEPPDSTGVMQVSDSPQPTLAEIKANQAAMTEKAKAQAKVDVEEADITKKNMKAFEVFNVGMKNLMEAMKGTETGPIVGRIPALTAEAQTAEGAVSAMAPVLKSLFRSAGEGVFTDKDQELLLDMLPTRMDEPEAREAKAKMVYDIVRAKLSVPGMSQANTPSTTQGPGGSVPDMSNMSDEDLWKLVR